MNIKKLFKEHSIYLLILTLIESIISIICTISFVYTDSLLYTESSILEAIKMDNLLQSIYSSTWWALILLLLFFIAIFNITGIVYRKLEYHFISICCWGAMLILSINLANPFTDILSRLALFVPIIIIAIICYHDESRKLENTTSKKKIKAPK